MEQMMFFVPGTPVAQPRHRISGRGGKRHLPHPKGGGDHPVIGWKAAIAVYAKGAFGRDSMEGPLWLMLNFWMPRTKGQTWKRKPMERMWHTVRPDADNLTKAVKDALTGILWEDDSQVCSLHVSKMVCGGEDPSGVYVVVSKETDLTLLATKLHLPT